MTLAHMQVNDHTHTQKAAHTFWYGGDGSLQGEGQRAVWLGLILRSVQLKHTQTHTFAVVKQQLIMRSSGTTRVAALFEP